MSNFFGHMLTDNLLSQMHFIYLYIFELMIESFFKVHVQFSIFYSILINYIDDI